MKRLKKFGERLLMLTFAFVYATLVIIGCVGMGGMSGVFKDSFLDNGVNLKVGILVVLMAVFGAICVMQFLAFVINATFIIAGDYDDEPWHKRFFIIATQWIDLLSIIWAWI